MYPRQTVARRDASKQRAQARRLLAASRQPAQYVLAATIADDRFGNRDVIYCTAYEDQKIGSLLIPAGAHFFLVKSKICERYYAVRFIAGQGYCSTSDKRDAAPIIARAKAYRNHLLDVKRQQQEVA